MTVSTTSAAIHITPTIVKTFLKHYRHKTRKTTETEARQAVATDDFLYDEAFNIVKSFIELGTQNRIESLQAFTNTHIPSPFWAAVVPVTVSLSSCNRAADLLIDWFGPEELATVVGGERWWQVRGLDGIYAEWITERKYLNGENGTTDNGVSGRHSEELLPQMEQLESVMLYIHGGGYFWGSINTHRYQIIRHTRKFKGRAFAVNYRKAPQYPWPCAIHDVLAAYFYLTQPPPNARHKPVSPAKLVFAGDSAGAALCVTTLTVLRDMGLPLPAGAVLISPWVDLTHSFPSIMSNTDTDILPPYGFVHKPSMAWPVEPLPTNERVSQTKTKPSPAPGHADTLVPSTRKTVDGRNSHIESGSQSADQLLNQSQVPEAGPPESRASGSKHGIRQESRTPKEYIDVDWEEIDRREPKPPMVLMENPQTVPLELRSQIQQYATNEQLTHPLVSPILQSSLCNLCPLFILLGDGEVLRDEIIYFAHRAVYPKEYPVRQGALRDARRQRENVERFTTPTKVHLQAYDSMPHVLTVFMFTHSAQYAYRAIAQFVKHATHNTSEHLSRNPFPEFHRPNTASWDSDSEGSDSGHRDSKEARSGKNDKVTKGKSIFRPWYRQSEGEILREREQKVLDIKLYKKNEVTAEKEVINHEVEMEPEAEEQELQSEYNRYKNSEGGTRDLEHVLMLRERVDINGHARPMEPKEDIQALRMRPSEVGVIKEAPVRRWLKGQEIMDQKFRGSAKRVLLRRKKYEARAAKMLADARDQGLSLHADGYDDGTVSEREGQSPQDMGGKQSSSLDRQVKRRASIDLSNRMIDAKIDEERRWGPLDLNDERPPPTAIAKRRDTPEAAALLKKNIYHTAPTTHKSVPKLKAMQAMRATLDPNDGPDKPPRQSVSEEQVRTHIMPVHGLSIWNSLVLMFMRQSSKQLAKANDRAAGAAHMVGNAVGVSSSANVK